MSCPTQPRAKHIKNSVLSQSGSSLERRGSCSTDTTVVSNFEHSANFASCLYRSSCRWVSCLSGAKLCFSLAGTLVVIFHAGLTLLAQVSCRFARVSCQWLSCTLPAASIHSLYILHTSLLVGWPERSSPPRMFPSDADCISRLHCFRQSMYATATIRKVKIRRH